MAPPVDRRLIAESAGARLHLAVAAALGVLSAALIIAQAALLAYVIERSAMHGASLASLRAELIALAAVLCARALAGALFDLSGRLGAVRVMSELRARLVQRMLGDPLARPQGRTGELAGTAVQGVDALEAYFAGYLPQLVLATCVPVAVIAWVIPIDPIAAGILAFTIPILIVFMVLIGKGARSRAQARWRALSLLGAHFLDVVQGLGTLRAYRRESAQAETIAMVGERYRSETMGTLRVAFLSALVLELCAMIGTALVAATIGVQLVDGVLGLQAGLTVLLLAPELYSPLRLVGQQFHASTDATTAFDRAFEILDGELQPTPAGRLAAPCPARKPLVMSAVSYDYPRRDGAVLQAVDLELRPGAITALIGPSGAGKSTVAMLLMGLALPSRGTIACGGLDLRAIDPDSWRSQIAWVPQRPTIFRGTVAENIALYRPAAGPREIERAARSAGVWELIQALPGGLQAAVGAGARGLSEGQAQRLALARALLADRPLLILDEPTAHLDQESAAELAGAIARAAEGRTALILAHHRSLTAIAQEVLTIDRGRLAPTPAELCGAAA